MRKRKKMYIILFSLIPVLILIAIAYAALSTSLTSSIASVGVTKQTWNVGFDTTNGTVSPFKIEGTSGTGRSCGNLNVTATTITVGNISLSKPGDGCIYALKIKNTGSIAAKVSAVVNTPPSGATCETASSLYVRLICDKVAYRLTTDDAGSTHVRTNDVIAAGATLPVYLIVRYNGNELNSSAVTQTGAKFQITYAQN